MLDLLAFERDDVRRRAGGADHRAIVALRHQFAARPNGVLNALDGRQVGVGQVVGLVDLGVQLQQARAVTGRRALVGCHEETQARRRVVAGVAGAGLIPAVELGVVRAVIEDDRLAVAGGDALSPLAEPATERGLGRLAGLELGAHRLKLLPQAFLFGLVGGLAVVDAVGAIGKGSGVADGGLYLGGA